MRSIITGLEDILITTSNSPRRDAAENARMSSPLPQEPLPSVDRGPTTSASGAGSQFLSTSQGSPESPTPSAVARSTLPSSEGGPAPTACRVPSFSQKLHQPRDPFPQSETPAETTPDDSDSGGNVPAKEGTADARGLRDDYTDSARDGWVGLTLWEGFDIAIGWLRFKASNDSENDGHGAGGLLSENKDADRKDESIRMVTTHGEDEAEWVVGCMWSVM